MKKILLILTIFLSMCLAALLVFTFYLSAAENGPGAAPSTETTLPGTAAPDDDSPLSSEPEEEPQATSDGSQTPPSGNSAQPDETTAPTEPEGTTAPTLDPDLDENETPRLEF